MLQRCRTRLRARLAGDAGLSLAEMVVALFVLTLVLGAFLSASLGAVASTRRDEGRTRANQLASEALEILMSAPWNQVGLFATDPGYSGTGPNSESTVTLPAATRDPALPYPPYPVTSVSRGGVTYELLTSVTWRDDPSDGLAGADANGNPNDIKHIVVTAKWTLNTVTRQVVVDGLRTPTADEVPPNSSGGLTVTATASPSQTLTADGHLTLDVVVTATTNTAANGVSVSYNTRGGVARTQALSNTSGNIWSWTFPASDTSVRYDPGPATYSFSAVTLTGSAANSATITFTDPPGVLSVRGSAAPAQRLDDAGKLTSDVVVSATTAAPATSVTVSYPTTAGTQTQALTDSGSGTSWSWTFTVAASAVYAPGEETYTFTATGPTGSGTDTASITLTAAQLPPEITAASISHTWGLVLCLKDGSSALGSPRGGLWDSATFFARVYNVKSTDKVTIIFPFNATPVPAPVTMSYYGTYADGSISFYYTYPADFVVTHDTPFIRFTATNTAGYDDYNSSKLSTQYRAKKPQCV